MKREVFCAGVLMVLGLFLVQNLGRKAENFIPYQTDISVPTAQDLQQRVPAEYRRSGALLVATHPTTPPTVFLTPDTMQLQGREIDIMAAVAQLLGLKLYWVNPGSLGSTVLGLASHRYDIALANLNVTETRLKKIDFVSYFDDKRLGLLGLAATQGQVTQWHDLCGLTIGAGSGTENATVLQNHSRDCKQTGAAPITVMLFPSRPAGVQAIISGRVPYFLGPYEGVKAMAQGSHGQVVLTATLDRHGSYVGMGLPRQSSLTPVITDAVNRLIELGIYQKILGKWDISYGAIGKSYSNMDILNSVSTQNDGRVIQ